jgi:probable rRNA maturation factor
MFEKLARRILRSEKKKGVININFVSDEEIRKLNCRFRKKDRPTDVLAFPFEEEGVLGDIAVALETVKKNARRFGAPYKKELKRAVIHGILHLLGYDHGRMMRRAEEIYQKF